MTTVSRSPEAASPLPVRVPGTSPAPRWRSGGAPPRSGRDHVTPRSPGRGRGPDRPTTSPPWAVLLPPTATTIDARTQRGAECLRQIAGLPSQSWVSIVDDRPLSRLRLRRLARRCGLVVVRELIVLRTAGAAVAVVEDVGTHAACVPLSAPSLTGALAPTLPLWLARVLPWSWTRWLASDRVLLARRR